MEEGSQEQQEFMIKASMLQQQTEQIQQQLQAVERSISEITVLNNGLDDLIGKEGEEIFAPIGKGIFAKAKLISEELTVDIGNKNFVKKSIPDTKKIIEGQIGKLGEVQEGLHKNLDKINRELMEMISKVEKSNLS